MRRAISGLLLLACLPAVCKPIEQMCEATVVAREAASESLEGARAVLDVLHNRMRIDGLTACQAVTVKGQWSWYHKNYKWNLSRKDLQRYEIVRTMPDTLATNVYYFRSGKHRRSWLGRYCCKIGNHLFYYKS